MISSIADLTCARARSHDHEEHDLRKRAVGLYLSNVVIGMKIELSRDCQRNFPSGSITPTTRYGLPFMRTSLSTGSS